MFSRLIKSARAYISEKPKPETRKSPRRAASNQHNMVTPGQSKVQASAGQEEELTEDNSINVYVPTSSAKKRKGRTQDQDMSDNDVFVTPSSKKRKLPVRGKARKSPKSPIGAKGRRPVVEILGKAVAPEELDFVAQDEEADSGAEELNLPVITPSKHHRFASEEPEPEFFSTAREQLSPIKKDLDEPIVIDSEEEDSDDEAPEAVDTQEAAKTIKLKEKEAAQIVKDQLSATRKKRKERDENFKRQSEMGKKRNTDLSEPKEILGTEDEGDDENKDVDMKAVQVDAVAEEEEESMTLDNLPVFQRKRPGLDLQRAGLPELLPAEYLQDSELTNIAHDQPLMGKISVSKKTKFRDLVGKQPKDKRIGSTTFRVTKSRSSSLAPKSAYQARSTKESWLQGRSGKAVSASRKPFSSGFLKK